MNPTPELVTLGAESAPHPSFVMVLTLSLLVFALFVLVLVLIEQNCSLKQQLNDVADDRTELMAALARARADLKEMERQNEVARYATPSRY
jgi:hypothetical protein